MTCHRHRRGVPVALAFGALLAGCADPDGPGDDVLGTTWAYRGTWDGEDFQKATLTITDRDDGGQTVTGTSVLDYAAVLAIRLVVTETVELGPDGLVETWEQDQRNRLGTTELTYHFAIDADGIAIQGLADHGASVEWAGDAPVLTYAWPSDGFFQIAHPTPVAGYVTGRALASGEDLRVVLPWYGTTEAWQADDEPDDSDCFTWFGDRWCLDESGVPQSFIAGSYGLPVGRLDEADEVAVTPVRVDAPEVWIDGPDCAVPTDAAHHATWKVSSPDGTQIAGRIVLPEGAGPFPVVIANAGTGGLDRTGLIPPSTQWDCLAHDLLASGVAVASYDDRGHGESGGEVGDSFHGRTDDVVAVAEAMRARTDVSSLFLLGHSEGAVHVTAAAARLDVDGLVLVAGPSGTGAEGWIEQARIYLESLGFPEAQVGAFVRGRESLVDQIAAGTYDEDRLGGLSVDGFWVPYLSVDGTASALATTAPVLVVQGEADWQVPAHHGSDLATALGASYRDVTLATFPGLGHLLQPAIGPASCGLEYHLPWSWEPEVTAAIGEWVAAHTP